MPITSKNKGVATSLIASPRGSLQFDCRDSYIQERRARQPLREGVERVREGDAMAQPVEQWITDIPPVTRAWVAAAIGTSVLVVSFPFFHQTRSLISS